MDEHQIKDLSQRYKIARDFESLLSHPGFIQLQEKVAKDNQYLMDILLSSGAENEHDMIVANRSCKLLLEHAVKIARTKESLAKRLAEADVVVD